MDLIGVLFGSQRVNRLLRGRRFEISSFRGFDFFDGGWGGGEKK